MIAVDTNILVQAHRQELPRHAQALRKIKELAEGDVAWGIPVFCVGEFLRVVTHPRIFRPPSSSDEALQALEGLLQSPSLHILSPGARFPALLADLIRSGQVSGNLVFDAQIAALCLECSVETFLTLDRDFSRFPQLRSLGLGDHPPQ